MNAPPGIYFGYGQHLSLGPSRRVNRELHQQPVSVRLMELMKRAVHSSESEQRNTRDDWLGTSQQQLW